MDLWASTTRGRGRGRADDAADAGGGAVDAARRVAHLGRLFDCRRLWRRGGWPRGDPARDDRGRSAARARAGREKREAARGEAAADADATDADAIFQWARAELVSLEGA